jgi:regulator of replication initiation timing
MDHTSDQVEAITRELNQLYQEIHELREELKRRGVEEVVIANTSPSERRGPGRPAKSAD